MIYNSNKTINWGIIGLGNIAKRFATSLKNIDDAKLYAVASKTKDKQDYFKDNFNPGVIYDDYLELIKDDKVDIVYIALPHAMHYEYALLALENKKAVLCEKPATLEVKQLEHLKEIAIKNNVFFMEAIKTRFIPFMDKINEATKQIGEITYLYANFCSSVDFSLTNKYYFDRVQGGAINDIGIYPLNFAVQLLGNNLEVKEVEVVKQPETKIDLYYKATLIKDTITIILEGAIDRNKDKVAIITGTKGKITIPYYYRPESLTIEYDDVSILGNKEILVDDLYYQIKEVHNCLINNQIESNKLTINDSIIMHKMIQEIKDRFN